MKINLKHIFDIVGEAKDIGYEIPAEDLSDIRGYEFAAPVKVSGRVYNRAGVVYLDYSVSFTLRAACDRCLKEFLREYDFDFNITIEPNLTEDEVDKMIDIDLKGTIMASIYAMKILSKQNSGSIYTVEGHGSNDATIDKLTVYGTAKRGVTYFTESLAHELKPYNITVGKITPGIMITNFIKTSLGDGEKIKLDEKTKKIYNILGDYPETIAKYIVPKVINNCYTNVKFAWLTKSRAFARFIKAMFVKRDIFK